MSEELKPEMPVCRLDLSKLDTNPIEIDLHEFRHYKIDGVSQYNEFHRYREGLYVRDQLGDKLKNSTSVKLINLGDFTNTKDFIFPSDSFLAGLFGDYIRENYRPLIGPDWLQDNLNKVSTDLLMSTKPITSDKIGFDALYSIISDNCSKVRLHSMVESMKSPAIMCSLHRVVCELKDWFDEHENLYVDKMCDLFDQYKGRWFRVNYGSTGLEDVDEIAPRVVYDGKSIIVRAAYCKLGGASHRDCFRFKEPVVAEKGTPIFYIGYPYDSSDHTLQVYPIVDSYNGVPCRLVYKNDQGGHEYRKKDRGTLLKPSILFPETLREYHKRKLFNQVYNANTKKLSKYELPSKE